MSIKVAIESNPYIEIIIVKSFFITKLSLQHVTGQTDDKPYLT